MPQHLTLVQMNDSHAYFEPHPELFWSGNRLVYRTAGGYARVASALNAIRAERPGAVLAFDGGDTFHGTYAAVHTQGEVLIPVLDALRFDAMTAHWDFAYGPARLRELATRLPYPVLAANCYDEATGDRPFPAWRICEAGGVRVGVIGLAAVIVDRIMPPTFNQGIRLTLGNDELPELIGTLRGQEQVDLVVVLSHLGFPQDMKLAREVGGIDVLLSSHTHNRLQRPARAGETLVIQSGSHGAFLGRLDLEIDGGRVVDFRHELLTVDDQIASDLDVQAIVAGSLAPYRDELGEVVGRVATPLNRGTALECTMDNFLLQALQHATGATLAFSNGWRYGAPVLPGPVTRDDLYNIIPVNPPVSLVDLTGEEIWSMLEENLEHTYARDPYQQMGGYVKRALGLNALVKIENPPGTRLQELFVEGRPVDRSLTYRAAFVTSQGVPKKYGSNRQALTVRAVDALAAYLGSAPEIEAPLRGTFTVI
ncbi:MAG: bifunctional metallophosphatase/5'-nucleotidase [Chloroflexi bacterium]|nr:bifunctional metallophosphatase/5'-nucleotidase [Chloroflexota bacterium]